MSICKSTMPPPVTNVSKLMRMVVFVNLLMREAVDATARITSPWLQYCSTRKCEKSVGVLAFSSAMQAVACKCFTRLFSTSISIVIDNREGVPSLHLRPVLPTRDATPGAAQCESTTAPASRAYSLRSRVAAAALSADAAPVFPAVGAGTAITPVPGGQRTSARVATAVTRVAASGQLTR